MKSFKRLAIFMLAFLLIQYSIIFAEPKSPQYEMNNFVWTLTNAIDNQERNVEIPKYFWGKNEDIITAINTAFKNNPNGEIKLKGLYANSGTITFEYMDSAPIYILSNESDLDEIMTYATTGGMTDFIVAVNVSSTAISSADAFVGVNPELAYGQNLFMVHIYDKSQITTNTQNTIEWTFPIVYKISFQEIDPYNSDHTVTRFVAEKTKKIDPTLSNTEKVKRVNEIMVSKFSYDQTSTSTAKHYAKTLVATNKGVCSAYAFLAFKMLNAVDVPCILVTGHGLDENEQYEEHMWLMFRNEKGEWKHFDPTFNDPVPDEPGRVFTKYLSMSSKELSEDHSWVSTDYTSDKNNATYNKLNKLFNPTVTLKINSPKIKVNNITFAIDSENKNVTPILINDTTFLPIRKLAEIMGASVLWEDTTKTITMYYKTKTIIMTVGSNIVNINGKDIQLNNTPLIKDGRTLFPLRNIMEIFDKQVDWIQETQEIVISTK